eukprot:4779012-Prymnesium_polylepis.1
MLRPHAGLHPPAPRSRYDARRVPHRVWWPPARARGARGDGATDRRCCGEGDAAVQSAAGAGDAGWRGRFLLPAPRRQLCIRLSGVQTLARGVPRGERLCALAAWAAGLGAAAHSPRLDFLNRPQATH